MVNVTLRVVPPEAPEELEVSRGETVRLRLVNPSASTIYRAALQGHRMTVTHADGQPVEPVAVDSLRIGMGERYDVLVEANNPGAWQALWASALFPEFNMRLARAAGIEDYAPCPISVDSYPTFAIQLPMISLPHAEP